MIGRMLEHGLDPTKVAEIAMVPPEQVMQLAVQDEPPQSLKQLATLDVQQPVKPQGFQNAILGVNRGFNNGSREPGFPRAQAQGLHGLHVHNLALEEPEPQPVAAEEIDWDRRNATNCLAGDSVKDSCYERGTELNQLEHQALAIIPDGPTAYEQIGLQVEGVTDDIERIQAHVFRRRVRVKEFFTNFDMLRKGRCTREEFQRGLANIIYPNMFNDPETPIDAEAIAEYFVEHGRFIHEPQVVNYVKFCDVVEEVFNVHQLEGKPHGVVPEPGERVLDAGGFKPRAVREEAKLWQVMRRVATLTETRGVDLSTCFNVRNRTDADIRAGRIEPKDFLANFPLAQSTEVKPAALSHAECHLLIQRYTDDNGFIRLFAFQRDIENLIKPVTSDETPFLTAAQNTRVLFLRESRGFPMQRPPGTKRQARPMSARATMSSSTTAATAPRQDVAFGVPGTAGTVRQRPATAGASRSMRQPQSARATPARPKLDVIDKLQKSVLQGSLRLRGCFQEGDWLRRGVCTFTQMRTALSVLRVELDPGEYEELFNRYKNSEGMFCYRDCCSAVDVGIDAAMSDAGGNQTSAVRALTNKGPCLHNSDRVEHEKLEAAISKRVTGRTMEVISVFDDFAASHWAKPGHVTIGQFQRAMDMLGFRLNEKQRVLLCQAYCDTEFSNEFNYVDFCASVDPSCLRAGASDAVKEKIALNEPKKVNQRSLYGNPYYDRQGTVRPCRPQSAGAPGMRFRRQARPPEPHPCRPIGMCG